METSPAVASETRAPRARPLWGALAVSLGVHAVLAACWLLSTGNAPPGATGVTTEVALHRVAAGAANALATPAAPPVIATTAAAPAMAAPRTGPAPAADAAGAFPAPSSVASTASTTPAAAGPAAPSPDDLRRRYLEELGRLLGQHLWYPPTAQARGLEGHAIVSLSIARDGRLLAAGIRRGSGEVLLDAGALETVRRAAPLPPLPDGIPDATLDAELPVFFRLDSRPGSPR